MRLPTRRRFLAGLGVGGLTIGGGCLARGSPNLTELDQWPPPESDDALDLWTWQHYWGNQAIAFQHVGDLEEITRETVMGREQFKRLDSGETTDVLHLPTRQFRRAFEADLLQPLPTELLPAWPPDTELRVEALSSYGDGDDYYGLPQVPLTFSLAIHTDRLDRTGSWSTLWNDTHEGMIDMPADPVLASKVAALYTGQDPNDPDDVDAIEAALVEQAPLVGTYWSDWYDCWRRFDRGETVAAVLPHPRMCLCSQDGTPIVYDPPDEGVLYSQSVLAIPSGAANSYAAAEFVDWAADFKTGTETGWNADEWNLYPDHPVDSSLRAEFERIASDLGIE